MKACPWPMERLLPHAAPMLLLDHVQSHDEAAMTAVALVTAANPFVTADGLPAHVGLELMAQTCGAWVGANALAQGEAVRLGFLLGTRRYHAEVAWFRLGQRLEITAEVVLLDQGMGVFACRIAADGRVLAEAQLSLFQPEPGDEMLTGMGGI